MSPSARAVSDLPGSARGQVEAPDGCGKGMTSRVILPRVMTCIDPICSTRGRAGRNCSIATRPTGTINSGLSSSISRSSQGRQLSNSSGLGTRSPPFGFFPGKQRHEAAMYTRARNCSSFSPSGRNHLNSCLPAVQAKGRPSAGSLSPGACPTSNTLERIALPTIGGRCMFGHSRHARRAAW